MGMIMFKRSMLTLAISAMALGLSSPSALAGDMDPAMQQALEALDAQLPGKLINNPYDIQWRTDGPDKREKVVEDAGVPGGYAYQVSVRKSKPQPWDIATRIPMTEDIAKGDVILLSFWMRAEKPARNKDTGNVSVALQRNIEPYDSIFDEPIMPTSEWQLYSVAGKAGLDYPQAKTQLNFNLARSRQTIEFGQFYIMNLGPDADPSKYVK